MSLHLNLKYLREFFVGDLVGVHDACSYEMVTGTDIGPNIETVSLLTGTRFARKPAELKLFEHASYERIPPYHTGFRKHQKKANTTSQTPRCATALRTG